MSLTAGERLGPYEVIAPVGAGGMGEVYRALDITLGRQVAVKILPDTFARDPERLARFEREAKALAALNHPNIAQIYGFEKTDGIQALIMELVDGPTLADRIARGSIPVDEALPIARQIADALEAAHEQGIIHRDLKPSNIKLRPDGVVKVLDFGLAKAMDAPPGDSSGVSMWPTVTTPGMTHAGIVVGTAPYMSPEQAKGKPVDRRGDIWAFGVVLCEMLTGQQLFTGDTPAETLAGVMKDVPKLDAVPANVRPIVERCLRRDLRKRWQAIGDVRIALEEDVTGSAAVTGVPPSRLRSSSTLAWVIAGLAVATAGTLAWPHFRETPPVRDVVRYQLAPPEKSSISSFAVSPDGRYVAFVDGDRRQLWVRAMDSLEAQVLPGADGLSALRFQQIFWSPDSRSIAFIAQQKLKRISISGGPPQTLTDADTRTRGSWGRGGVILLSQGPNRPIQRVPEGGGVLVSVTHPAEGESHFNPHFLPDGRHFLYRLNEPTSERSGIYLSSLDEGAQPVRILPGAAAATISATVYSPPVSSGGRGHLLFVRDNTLMAQPFEPETRQLIGETFLVAAPVTQFSASQTGALVYTSGRTAASSELIWLDRNGKLLETAGPSGEYSNFRLSPDEKSIVFNRTDGNLDIWVLNMSRGVPSKISFDPGVDNLPIWSPDGLRILWPSNRKGSFDLYRKPASGVGTGQDELFMKMGTQFGWGTDWSRDGKFVLYVKPGAKGDRDLWIAPQSPEPAPDDAQKPFPYLQSPFNEEEGVFHPSGRWIAYVSDESGRPEVYVQAFPATIERDQISTGGGTSPAWSRDGTQLFYLADDRSLMALPVRAGATAFEPGAANALFVIPGTATSRVFEPAGNGTRFLIARPKELTTVPMTVVLNWDAGIKN